MGRREVLVGYTVMAVAALACSATAAFPHLFAGHDIEHALYMLDNVAQGISDGQFPVYLHHIQAQGAGYAMGVMYPSAFFVPAALLHVAGLSLDDAYRALVVMVNGATALVAYWSFRRILRSERVALAVALLWLLAPYRLENVLLRAAIGESIALVFFPLLACGVYRSLYGRAGGRGGPVPGKAPAWVPLGIAFSGIVLSHVVSIVVLLVFALPTALVLALVARRPRFLLDCVKAAALVLVLTAWFTVPFLDFYLNAGLASGASVTTTAAFAAGNAVNPLSLLLLFEPMAGGSQDMTALSGHMPVLLGWGVLLPLAAGAVSLAAPRTRALWSRQSAASFAVLAVAALIVCLMATCVAPWGTERPVLRTFFGLLASVQFPWRLLGLGTFMALLAAALFLDRLWAGRRVPRAAKLGALVACLALGIAQAGYGIASFVELAVPVTADQIREQSSGIAVTGDIVYLPVETDRDELLEAVGDYPKAEGVEVVSCERFPDGVDVALKASPGGGTVTLPLVAYPYYRSSDAACTVSTGENGLVSIAVAPGFEGEVQVLFTPPPAWTVACWISIAGLIALVVYVVAPRRRAPRGGRHAFSGPSA